MTEAVPTIVAQGPDTSIDEVFHGVLGKTPSCGILWRKTIIDERAGPFPLCSIHGSTQSSLWIAILVLVSTSDDPKIVVGDPKSIVDGRVVCLKDRIGNLVDICDGIRTDENQGDVRVYTIQRVYRCPYVERVLVAADR